MHTEPRLQLSLQGAAKLLFHNQAKPARKSCPRPPFFLLIAVSAADAADAAAAVGIAVAPGGASLSARWACSASASSTLPTPVPIAAVAVAAGGAAACDGRGGGGSAGSFCLVREGWVASRNGSREMTVAVAMSFPKAMARRASIC